MSSDSLGGRNNNKLNQSLNNSFVQNDINKQQQNRSDQEANLDASKTKEAQSDAISQKKIDAAKGGGSKTQGVSDVTGIDKGTSIAAQNLQAAINDKTLDLSLSTKGTGAAALATSYSAADTASAAENLKGNLQGNNANTFSQLITVAAATGNAHIAASIGGANRGSIHTRKPSKLAGLVAQAQISGAGNQTSSTPTPSQLAMLASAKKQLSSDDKLITAATALLHKAVQNFNQACKEYGSGSPTANAAEKNLNNITTSINSNVKDAFSQVTKAKGLAGHFPGDTALQSTASSMNTSFQDSSNNASTLMALGAGFMIHTLSDSDGVPKSDMSMCGDKNSSNSLDLTNESIFGGYNPSVLAGSCVEIQVMKAMAKMDSVANTVAARQTKIEKGMETIQTTMNNYLSQQLAAENPILSKLAALGKKEASASQVSTGIFSLPGNLWKGTIGGASTGLETSKAWESSDSTDTQIKDNYSHAWEGIGETFGFTSSASTNLSGDIVAVNGRLSQLNSENQVATQKVSNLTTEVNAQGQAASSSAQSTQSINQMMTSILGLWSKAMGQAISSG